ncbi:hypothetical protein CWI38_1163p0020 [Hamiltosporidium tvaerminnensis]|uniref:Uncharacterized protein n=1 Tax=Hamiltosporidium tvaerminnensis TaxID=1176355 RepID=A0A4Q9LSH4_9MICR|nr:hypothetical protein CWI38_1163p0020 [Hamiltosporidium tvaerminnensis]
METKKTPTLERISQESAARKIFRSEPEIKKYHEKELIWCDEECKKTQSIAM